MSSVIIHISDLHVTTFQKNDFSFNKDVDSYLTTNVDKSGSTHFVRVFTDKIKQDYAGFEYIILITGDISNTAEKKEFAFAQKFLELIIQELNVKSDQILLLPGDHDVHRRSLENALADAPNDKPYLMNDIKYANFAAFYKEIKKADFSNSTIIIDHLVIDKKIVLLGINSNYKVGTASADGYLPLEEFTKELDALKALLGAGEYQFVACWHHNITAGYENKNSGQWDSENRKQLLATLERQNIKLVLTGNEHTNNAKGIKLGSIWTSDSGAFSTIKYDTTFKVYSISTDPEVILGNKSYALQKTHGNDKPYFWDVRSNSESEQPDNFVLFEKNDVVINDVVDLPHDNSKQTAEPAESERPPAERIFYNNPLYAEELYAIIRREKLFHSGHFHWSETSRAHNWIDVSKLLESSKTLYFVQNAIIDIISTFDLAIKTDLIIGLGYEGNIIASKASIKYNIPYTSLPYSYRYSDHHDYEKKLNYDNENGDFKTVIVITDVVNDGRTIRKLIDKREKGFFGRVEKIIVLSLFYTGHEEINIDILNYDNLPTNYDRENDHKVNNIEFYTVKSLRVEKCPFGDNYKNECLVYKDGLSCVHLFYAEKA